MQTLALDQNTPEWLEARLGKITGSKVKDVIPSKVANKTDIETKLTELGIEFDKKLKVGELEALLPAEAKKDLIKLAPKKVEFYQLIADKLSIVEEEEMPMDRGHRLEDEAIAEFSKAMNKEVEKVGFCISDIDPDIANSPDGLIKVGDKWGESVEVKCLKAARHLMAYFEQKVPEDYWPQVLQGFVVNPDLEKMYFVFYDPRVTAKPIHWLVIEREQVAEEVQEYLEYQLVMLEEARELLTKLAF